MTSKAAAFISSWSPSWPSPTRKPSELCGARSSLSFRYRLLRPGGRARPKFPVIRSGSEQWAKRRRGHTKTMGSVSGKPGVSLAQRGDSRMNRDEPLGADPLTKLTASDLHADPIVQFQRWLEQAALAGVCKHTAMTL